MANDGGRAGLGVVDAASLRSAVADAGLSDDQAAAVAQLCRAACNARFARGRSRIGCSFSKRLGELEQELAQIAARRDELAPVLRAAEERLRWRRPRRELVGAARAESDKRGHRRLEVVESRDQMSQRVSRLGQDLAAADAAADRLPALEAEQADRERWLRSQPSRGGVGEGAAPADRRPHQRTRRRCAPRSTEHLVRLLGQPGTSLSHDEWAGAAGRMEAYRERWRLKPNEMSRPPSRNSAQAKHWREVDLLLPELQRSQTRPVIREVDHGLSM